MRPRIVYSSAECPADTLQMQRDASSSASRRLAAMIRRAQIRAHLGDVVLGVIGGAIVVVGLALAGVW